MRQWAVLSAGSTHEDASGSISYSIGQSFYSHHERSLSLEEGVQQGFCIPTIDTIRYEICQGERDRIQSLLPSGYSLPATISTDNPGQYSFMLRLLSEGGCDSILFYMLTVYPHQDTDLYVQSSECYQWHGTDLTLSGDYDRQTTTVHGCDSLMHLHLVIIEHLPLPVIWNYNNEVLFVGHKYEGYSSAHYADYRWYRDGVLMVQDTAADKFFNADGSPLSGCYYLEVPTDSTKEEWVVSNTICIGKTGVLESAATDMKVNLYPNPVAKGSEVHIVALMEAALLEGATLRFFDVQGRNVLTLPARTQTDLVCDFPTGIYFVHLTLSDGRHSSHKLVVR